jgi:hypothetical protein
MTSGGSVQGQGGRNPLNPDYKESVRPLDLLAEKWPEESCQKHIFLKLFNCKSC